MLHRPEGTFNHDLAEFLDWKAPANTIPVNGVYSFEEVLPIRRLVVYQRRSHACSMVSDAASFVVDQKKRKETKKFCMMIL
ncbi:hypothetical protein DCAR_0206371 [Daucus carota subsp. sativus]|uniref:Uncharacterized protein n=1 Tax=Daucus carota subsp. sativus TaxID=79200 RepID=A0A161X420_DAUCS|nr:hypothetical protein DCAR_0206371 [Daucus carota subsp. sativus]